MSRRLLRWLSLGYLGVLVVVPVGLVFEQAFSSGWAQWWQAVHDPEMDSALWLTVRMVALVVPVNTLFGLALAWLVVRRPSPLTRVIDVLADVPLAISPIVVGLMLELAYSPTGWLGPLWSHLGVMIIFSWPGVAMASATVSLPLVVRQVIPVLRSAGVDREWTAASLGASPVTIARTITWPTVRWAVAYGVTLSTARVIGEYGAVLIVSGNIAQRTQTLTLNIAQNFDNFDSTQGFAGAALLTASALVLLALLGVANERERRARGD